MLELLTNFFLAMHDGKQNANLHDRHERMIAETLQTAAVVHGTSPAAQQRPAPDPDAYRMKLMKLRADEHVSQPGSILAFLGHDHVPFSGESGSGEEEGRRTVDRRRSHGQEVDAGADARDLPGPVEGNEADARNAPCHPRGKAGSGFPEAPVLTPVCFQLMCAQMRALTPNEKAELQKRFKQNPPQDPNDFANEAARVRKEQEAQQGQMAGCFQVRAPFGRLCTCSR